MSRSTNYLRLLLLLLFFAHQAQATSSSVNCNFNGTPIAAGNKIWFNSVMKITGTATYPLTIYFTGQTISSPAFTLSVPDAILVLDPAVTTATTVFNGTAWVTTAPPDAASFYFLSGCSDSLLASLPGSLDPVVWSGNFTASRPGVSVKWHMAAAVYTHFNSNLNNLGVKPSDCNSCSIYPNSHQSGSPENYLSYVIGGARGGGGNNYTGGYSGIGSVTPDLEIADASVCVGGNVTLTASTSGSWSSGNISVATISTSGVVHGVAAGTAIITHSISGCGSGSPQTVLITVVPGATIGATATPVTACSGGSVTLGVSGAGTGCTYSWHGPSGYSSASASPVRSGLLASMAGAYSVTVTSSNGCVSSATTPVTSVNQLPSSITASVVPTHVCAATSFSLNGTVTGGSGYTLSWTGGASTINNAATTAANVTSALLADATIYTLTATVPGCGSVSGTTAALVVSAAPTSTGATNSGPLCGGSSATLYANTTNATSWSWTGPGGYTSTAQNPSVPPTATTTYSLIASNPGSGCAASSVYTTTVTVGALPATGTITGAATLCAGAIATLTNTVSGSWSSSSPAVATVSTTGVVTGINGGTATISFTATNSCGSATTTKVITVNPLPASGTISGASSVCVGASTALTSSVTGGSWTTSNSAVATVSPSGSVSGVAAGAAIISYNVSNSCGSNTATKAIAVSPSADAGTISGASSVCVGASTALSSTVGGGSWTTSNSAIATVSSSGSVSGIASGSVTISYSVSNSCGSNAATKAITVSPSADAGTISGASSVCVGASTALSSTVGGGSWTISNSAIATVSPSGSVSGIASGSVTISYSVSNSCGSNTVAKAITVSPSADAGTISGASSICVGTSTALTSSVGGGSWTTSNPAIATVSPSGSVSGVAAGSVTISYYVSNSCGSSTVTKAIAVSPSADAGTISGASSVCVGASTALSSTVGGGSWNTSNSAIATVSPSGSVSGIASGSVTISYNVSNSCGSNTATKAIAVSPSADAGTISGASSVCVGASTALSSTVGGGSWNTSNSAIATVSPSGAVSGIASGSVTISYSVSNSCGSSTTTKAITVSPSADAGTISGASSVCVGASTALSSTVGGGSWTTSNPAIATVSPSGSVSGVAAGSAIISYNVSNSCGSSTATKAIVVNPLPYAGTISGATSVCVGELTALSSDVTGGTWSTSNASVGSVNPFGFVTGVAAGSAAISYTVSNSCGTNTAIEAITVSPLPDAGTISGPSSVCAGASMLLGASVGSGTWTSGNTSVAIINTSGVVSGVAAGSALISYTVSNSCGNAVATYIVSVNAAPDAGTIVGPNAVCSGLSTNMVDAVSGGIWSSSSPSVATIDLSGAVTAVSAGVTTISYTVSNGCGSNTATRALTVNASSSGLVGPDNVNIGGNITLTVVGGSWISSNPAIAIVDGAGNITGLSAGTTNISYTLSNGCYSFVTSKVITVDPIAPITGTLQICQGGSSTLAIATPGGSWSCGNTSVATVASSGLVSGVGAGTATISYSLLGTVTTAIVTVNALPASIAGGNAVCIGGTLSLTDAMTGGSWSTSNASISVVDATSGTLNGLSAGTVQIQYTLPTGCSTITTVTVSGVNPITGANVLCAGSSATLSNSTTGGSWSSSTPTVATVNAVGVVSTLPAASGTAIITYTSPAGCIATQAITVNAAPAVISGPTAICAGSAATYTNAVTGGTWSTASSNISIDATGNVNTVSSGLATITYTLATGCSRSLTMTVYPTPAAIAGPATVCVGGTVTVTDATSGGTWSSSNTAIATIGTSGVVTGVGAGSATLTYTLAGTCATTASISVSAGLPNITGNTPVCAGSTLALSNTFVGGSWSSANTAVATVDATGMVTGVTGVTARISYSAAGGCNATVVVTVNAIAAITGSTSTCLGTTITLSDATTGGTWSSSDATVATIGSSSGVVTGVNNGSTVITYALSNGCARTTTVNIATMTPITGTLVLCQGLTTSLANATTGGVWSSSNVPVANVGTNGVVTGGAAGVANISYTANGCRATAVVTVLSSPAAITGLTSVCIGSSIALNDVTAAGTWSTSSANVSLGGVTTNTVTVTGISTGVAPVTYTAGTNGCFRLYNITVNSLPLAIAGTFTVCPGGTATLSDPTTGGAWSTADATIASPLSSGVVNGIATGTTTITYKLTATGCYATTAMTVIPSPSAISGSLNVCTSSTTSLSDADGAGTWSSSNITQATVGSLTGVVSGVSAGTSNITFTLAATGCRIKSVVTVTAIPNAGTLAGATSVSVGSTITITTTGTPGGDWSASNTNATVGSTGIVTGVSAGSVTITYAATNACGYSGAYKPITVIGTAGRMMQPTTNVPVTEAPQTIIAAAVTEQPVTGTQVTSAPLSREAGVSLAPVQAVDVRVVPNPNKGTFTIAGTLGTTESGAVAIEIADMTGRIIYNGKVMIQNGALNQPLELDIPANGTYLLHINSASGKRIVHFVVKH